MQDLETRLRSLLKGKFSSLSLSFNEETGPNYQTVEDYVTTPAPEWVLTPNWVSDQEKWKAAETNSMWTLHWYPDTPIGFCYISASSIEAIIDYLEV
jgi:hypothetical protein